MWPTQFVTIVERETCMPINTFLKLIFEKNIEVKPFVNFGETFSNDFFYS